MGRFFVEKRDVLDGIAHIAGKEARHMIEVMRLVRGASVVMFDGEGSEYRGIVKDIDRKKKELTVEIKEARVILSELPARITLAQAIPKKNKMDLIVEKATELGVDRIVPMITERTEVRPGEKLFDKMTERWRRIALEASKQCARPVIPAIDRITDFKDVLGRGANYDICLLACLSERSVPIRRVISGSLRRNVLIMVGPEGDFSPRESDAAEMKNFALVSLGSRVMKSDTAGLFVVTAIGYEGGNFDPAV
jgi:16S rRNA (uracil1498-N3)-methyltransferase